MNLVFLSQGKKTKSKCVTIVVHNNEPYFNDENIRFVPKWSYKIIYLIGDIDITILSVFNTSQYSIKFRK